MASIHESIEALLEVHKVVKRFGFLARVVGLSLVGNVVFKLLSPLIT